MVPLEILVSLAKQRGFVWQGSEIYGGLAGTWDWGPLGVFLKNNIKAEWWKAMLKEKHIFPLDTAILMNPKVWEASGHVEHFSDPLTDCKKCKRRFRQDDIGSSVCPECGGELTQARQFNMMFKTFAGPVEDTSSAVWLRPETAQGIFTNFKNIIDAFHPTLPFGIAQVGKAFRNEITPKNFVFRSREFEQMELEYFSHPDKAEAYFQDIRQMRMGWFLSLGISPDNIRLRDYKPDELAHYSKATTDIEYRYGLSSSGFSELEGIANRGDFDLSSQARASGEDFRLDGVVPHVVEPSVGLDRAFLAFFMDAYHEDEVGGEKRVVLRLDARLAPVKAAVFPLVSNKEQLVKKAEEIFQTLRQKFIQVAWDDIGNIGKRYRRQDEVGTPWCITVDYETLENQTVTVRDRDTTKQERVHTRELDQYIESRLK
ncbi:MAG: glycine--tRNA ligase [Candidatus Ryanbacteria bacterium]|nr:glycine--tRNA ligase [Candidatus Ryanbacteria bacterium]